MDIKNRNSRKTSRERNSYINGQKRYNSQILLYKKYIKIFFLNANLLASEKRNNNNKGIKKAKSSWNNHHNKIKSDDGINTKKIYEKRNRREKQNQKNKINSNIKYQPNTSKKVIKYKLIRNIYNKEQRKTTTSLYRNNITNINKIINTAESSINKKSNYIRRINLKYNIDKSNYKYVLNKYKNPSKVSHSLDNISTKTIINKINNNKNKNKNQLKPNSFDNKTNKMIINISPNIKLKYMENKLNTNSLLDNNKIKNNINSKNKNRKNKIYNNKLNSYNISKINSENISINGKPKPKITTKEIYNNISVLDVGQENNEKINGVKINNFDVKKPKEQNLKYTVIKDDIKDNNDLSVSQASKVIIGKIDGYKDIIENDKKNKFKFNSNLYKNKNVNKEFYESLNLSISNNMDAMSSTNTNNNNNKIGKNNFDYNNDSNYLKTEQILNKNNKNKSINNSSISFSINTEKSINDFSKIINYNVINLEENKKEEKINVQKIDNKNSNESDNCTIF